jgi:hypothetical protein
MADTSGLEDKLIAQVKRLLESVWERRADLKDIDEWLAQFTTHDDPAQCERLQMLFLLSQFMYFGMFEMRALLRSLYRDHFEYPFVERFRRANGDTRDRRLIDDAFREELGGTRFVGLGNPSESSSHILYYFRQENRLEKRLFIGPGDIFHFVADEGEGFLRFVRDTSIDHYVLIDDLCGSGDQAEAYSNDIALPLRAFAEREGRAVRVSYFALFGTSAGLKQVRDLAAFDHVECVVELDQSFRCFDPKSRYFANERPPISQAFAEDICRTKGGVLVPNNPLGYDDSQLLIGFGHNTPDNTLPIFSFDEPSGPPWTPIFRRYAKIDA